MKFSIRDSFSKCDQIRRFLGVLWHLLKKFLMENFIFCAVHILKITLKKANFFVIEEKIYINNCSRLHLPCRKTSNVKAQ